MACTWLSSLISGAWLAAIRDARVAAAWLPTGAWAGWSFMITITCRFTFCDSAETSAGVSGSCARPRAAGAAVAASAATDGQPQELIPQTRL